MGTNCLNTLLLENVGSALLKVGVHGSLVTDGLSQDLCLLQYRDWPDKSAEIT